ncbi:DNA/RNA helicase domain-containing protein [Victivallis vadensis]|uniref:DNA/RNA helicase domain-containing protein n=1 Tax=Victivallis vadensis TaxID=172901 RepID=UPI00259950C3|nr:DNA/RNA helicase domain-containing protein [Victivallis vadensis]
MERFFYQNNIAGFFADSEDTILGTLARSNSFDLIDLQRNAWIYEIVFLKNLLRNKSSGQIIFEYSIPRLGKRIDAVLLLHGIVFVLEFKVGAAEYSRQDLEQVWDYALDLKNFHEASRNLTIVPILVATNADSSSVSKEFSQYADHVFEPIFSNAESLPQIIAQFVDEYAQDIDLSRWVFSRYMPTPTIIQAASSLYLNHSVADITKTEASGVNLQRTSEFVMNIIDHSRANGEKSICFVTGVPGAGKTLVGLNIAVRQFEKKDLAVYLSGNQPLVSVLSEALARDKKRQEEERNPGAHYNLTEARRNVKSFIQIVHHYRDATLSKLKKTIKDGILEIDPTKVDKHKDDGYSEVEHVAIFDEAQRAWTKTHLANWLNRKKGIADFPMSEPEFLIWSLNLREDWAVVVCLVGGGQEINTGEAGIGEWLRAINANFRDWNVFISDQLTGKEYAEGELEDLLAVNAHVKRSNNLHLAVSMRSFRAEQLSHFVHHLLEGNLSQTQSLWAMLKDKYPIVITRNLNAAKDWLRKQKRGTERYGMVVSSQAQRLRPLAIDVRCKPDTVHWFLDDITDIRSSLFLEDAASEFDVQGLELDWTCLVWDGDLRRKNNAWQNFSFTGSKWLNIRSEERKTYQINAYRVLLTRARQGMVICVPEGNSEDPTRLPEFYDGTYEYFKQIGLKEI